MKHKWIEKIGVTSYPDNNFEDKVNLKSLIRDIRYLFQKHKIGFNPKDCWNLDATFYMWLYEHLKQFLDDADIVDLNYYKFNYRDKSYTQLELINLLCSKLEQMIKWDEFKGISDDLMIKEFVQLEDGSRKLVDKSTEEEREQFKRIYEQNTKEYIELRDEIFDLWKILIDYTWW